MIDLPEYPSPAAATPALVDFGAVLQPPLGGPVQRLNRMGSRFAISVTLPTMFHQKHGRIWVSRLIRGKTEGARMEFPLVGFNPGTPGEVKVDGSGQTGTTLNVKGATPNYIFREGQFFSIETDGVHYLYPVATETIADSSGDAAVPLAIMLRAQHLDDDDCHFGKPMIEGLIHGDELQWQWSIGNFANLEFSIVEAR